MEDQFNFPPTNRGSVPPKMPKGFGSFIADMIINDPDAPEEMKIDLRIIQQSKTVSEIIRDKFAKCTLEEPGSEKRLTFQQKKDMYEYLCLVETGLENYLREIGLA